MPQLHLTWVTAGAVAAVLVGVGALLSAQLRRGRVAGAVREVGIVVGLFALWMFVGHLVGHHPAGAYRRGAWIWHVEQTLHVADEADVQQPLLHHRWLAEASNYYYAYAHWLSVDVALAWLWLRHRSRYVVTRTALVLFTGCCLVLHLVSTAPPRLLAQTHLLDTGALLGQSVYGDTPGLSDHLSAMPSIHVGWAVLFLAAVWTTGSRPARAVAATHVVLTAWVVVATGNHFWLDGVAAAAIVAVVVPVAVAIGAAGHAWKTDLAIASSQPVARGSA